MKNRANQTYILVSPEHNWKFWKRGRWGYTYEFENAEVFTQAEIDREEYPIMTLANAIPLSNTPPNDIAIPVGTVVHSMVLKFVRDKALKLISELKPQSNAR